MQPAPWICALILPVIFACAPAPAVAQAASEETREVDVHFPAGTTGTTINDTIIGYGTVTYSLGAEAGQRMRVTLTPSNLATYFNVYGPGNAPGDAALANSGLGGEMMAEINLFDAVLPLSGEYTIQVYMMRSAARRDERSDYTLDISITGETSAIVEGDYADGLQGGPDAWEVRSANGLNIRGAPSTGAPILVTAKGGTILRNDGCRMAEARRWCQVGSPSGDIRGWAVGEFLVEAALPAAASSHSPKAGTRTVVIPPASRLSTVRAGTLQGGEAVNYEVTARAGQNLTVELEAASDNTLINIFAPDGDLVFEAQEAGSRYRGTAAEDGTLTIAVYSLAGPETASNYQIAIGLE
ncbi:MAG: SH3 domain-containing protein [Pseudomonadota bacterium]